MVLYFKRSSNGKLWFLFSDEILFSSPKSISYMGPEGLLNTAQWLECRKIYLHSQHQNRMELVVKMDLERETKQNEYTETVRVKNEKEEKRKQKLLRAAATSWSSECISCHSNADPRVLLPFQTILIHKISSIYQKGHTTPDVFSNTVRVFHPAFDEKTVRKSLLTPTFNNNLVVICGTCADGKDKQNEQGQGK